MFVVLFFSGAQPHTGCQAPGSHYTKYSAWHARESVGVPSLATILNYPQPLRQHGQHHLAFVHPPGRGHAACAPS